MKQKEIFLQGEGDAWYERNTKVLGEQYNPDEDLLLQKIRQLAESRHIPKGGTILEVGCGDGSRLSWIQKNLGLQCFGIDPSQKGIDKARENGIEAVVATADRLPYDDNQFDLLIYGFCLYLCDREDLTKIVSEADRAGKAPGWILIKDFYSPVPSIRDYHHKDGVKSFKMDYSALFSWHPQYTLFYHEVIHHSKFVYTDDEQEWISISLLRKT
jgi:ubiquinone/menaquinone biosynthesis C-methylase UbiE